METRLKAWFPYDHNSDRFHMSPTDRGHVAEASPKRRRLLRSYGNQALSILRRVFCICNLSFKFRLLLCVVGCGSGGCIVAYCPREPVGRFLLENDCSIALEWFADNFMKLNADKCHLLVLGQRCDDPVTVRIGSADVVNSSEEKLLGVQVDSKLSFDNHVSKLCQKASNKLYALARISPYMDQKKLRTLMRAFITSQFQYCPLIWMFHSRQLNKKINKIQERALRITYKDAESTYSELLEKDCAVTIHTKNLQLLMTEMYKTRNDLNPSFMQEIFLENESHYNLRSNNDFVQPRVRSVGNGTESVRFKGPQLWQILPQTIRNSESLAHFKANIKDWKGENCPCKLCRTFIPNLGFL